MVVSIGCHLEFEDDQTPSRVIVERYRATIEEDEAWEVLRPVHRRGGGTEFDLAAEYCASDDPLDRRVGTDILSELGTERVGGTFIEESLKLLIPMLADPESTVAASAAHSLAHRGDPAAIPHLVGISEHSDVEVRMGVAHAIMGHEEPEAIRTLIRLSTDSDASVRDLALFGLGTQIDTDTPDIRDALAVGVGDDNGDARAEAQVGLARRGDDRVVEALLAELQRPQVGSLSLEAAAAIAAPQLAAPLQELQDRWASHGDLEEPFATLIREAIATCENQSPPDRS